MKKVILICLAFLILPVFAQNYKLNKQYKTEMERIIDKEYPKVLKRVDKYVDEAAKLYNKVLKYGYFSNNQMNVINLVLIYENCTPTADIDLYAKLTKVTQEKYLKMEFEPIGTDWTSPYEDFITPYLKDNHVNIEKLNDIANYITKKNRIIKQYVEQAEKLRPTAE